MDPIDRDGPRRREMVEAARAAAVALGGGPLGINDFSRAAGISDAKVYRLFDSWGDLCRQAGIEPKRAVMRIADDDLFAAMRDAFVALGGVPGRVKFAKHFVYSVGTFNSRGWTWPQALFAFREWALANAPDFPHFDGLPESLPARRARMKRQPVRPAPRAPAPRVVVPVAAMRAVVVPVAASGAVVEISVAPLGEMVNFRALVHSPVNEQGVVLLFGMVAEELGYAIEAVCQGFPDCEAKRRMAGGRWQRVRVEFEYRSRSFHRHGHDPAGCDVIVCWAHDWAACPLEVLELRTAIAALGPALGPAPARG